MLQTLIALLDALKQFDGPIIELHISNIHRREAVYHNSLVSKAETAVITRLAQKAARRRWPPCVFLSKNPQKG